MLKKRSKLPLGIALLILLIAILMAWIYEVADAHLKNFPDTSRINDPSNSTLTVVAPKLEAPIISADILIAKQNEYRASLGLAPLIRNEILMKSAQAKAEDMVAKNYWAHISPDGTEPWFFFTSAGYSYERAGENLAYGFVYEDRIVKNWINSPKHEENLRADYTEIGVGIVHDVDYQGAGHQNVVVAHYASPY